MNSLKYIDLWNWSKMKYFYVLISHQFVVREYKFITLNLALDHLSLSKDMSIHH